MTYLIMFVDLEREAMTQSCKNTCSSTFTFSRNYVHDESRGNHHHLHTLITLHDNKTSSVRMLTYSICRLNRRQNEKLGSLNIYWIIIICVHLNPACPTLTTFSERMHWSRTLHRKNAALLYCAPESFAVYRAVWKWVVKYLVEMNIVISFCIGMSISVKPVCTEVSLFSAESGLELELKSLLSDHKQCRSSPSITRCVLIVTSWRKSSRFKYSWVHSEGQLSNGIYEWAF